MPRGLYGIEDWIERSTLATVQKYQAELIRLGISDETFRHDRPCDEVVELLVNEGKIPRLEASDIVSNAKRFFKKQYDLSILPLAVFWDVENMHIPTQMSGIDVAHAIKSAMRPFGVPTQLTAYFEITNANVPAEKRSQLQLSGFHLIDTPHINRKEVADKMIIVDALLFVMQHAAEGATLAFITGDTDYAYLLSRLSDMPKVRTILVTQQRSLDVLHRAAGALLSWEVDVLAQAPILAAAAATLPNDSGSSMPTAALGNGGASNVVLESPRRATLQAQASNPATLLSVNSAVAGAGFDRFSPTASNMNLAHASQHRKEENVVLLQSVLREMHDSGRDAPTWQELSQKMKDRYPLLFQRKDDRQEAFNVAVGRHLIGTMEKAPGQTVCWLRRQNQTPVPAPA